MNDYPRCKTCRYWERREYLDFQEGGVCVLARGHDGRPQREETRAFAYDASSYQADLYTHEDFGCVQHDPMPEVIE